MEILNIENLTFKYPQSSAFALKNVSFGVNEGDFVLLCGASGSGKTTLLRLLKEEIAPFGEKSGSISFKEGCEIAIVTQNAENQIVSDTVWHNLAFALESQNKPSYEIRQKIAEIAEFFDITHLFHKNTFELSGGEKQLLNLASVMVTDPDILLLDEPTCQLDPIAARRFTDVVKRLNTEMNVTVIISEHQTEELWSYADKVIVMDNGHITMQGTGEWVADNIEDHTITLPCAVKLYKKLGIGGKCPTTVGECKRFLADNFKNDIKYLEEEKTENETALELKDVYFRYDKKSPDVLKKLNFKAEFGKILTLLGGNGSGKTTLLSLISKINKPYSGKVKINGKKCVVLPQNVRAVFTKEVLREDLALITDNFQEICDKLSISHLLDRNPYDLSGGESERAAIAKVLLLNPDIICLDEPTRGLDEKGKTAVKEILENLAKEGICIIIVTHDADFAAEISDECSFIFDGQIVSKGSAAEVFSKNKFYTTTASVISRHLYHNTVTVDAVVKMCKRNGQY